VLTVSIDKPRTRDCAASRLPHYGLTQGSFCVYEPAYLVVDAIRRAYSDTPAVTEEVPMTTNMSSRLGGNMRRANVTTRIRHWAAEGKADLIAMNGDRAMVELRGIEPLTSSLRTRRSPN
jgi:hypothetical protein